MNESIEGKIDLDDQEYYNQNQRYNHQHKSEQYKRRIIYTYIHI